MSLLCDGTGFPMIRFPELGFAVQMLPLTKIQYECFLSRPGLPGDLHYERLLKTNPRVSFTEATPKNLEGLFVTGILPDEVEEVAQWFGPEWRIPSRQEWQTMYAALADAPLPRELLGSRLLSRLGWPARETLAVLQSQRAATNLLQLCWLQDGLLEWVHVGSEWGGLGEPRPEFASYVIDPLNGEPIIPIRFDARLKEFGARLFRNL